MIISINININFEYEIIKYNHVILIVNIILCYDLCNI